MGLNAVCTLRLIISPPRSTTELAVIFFLENYHSSLFPDPFQKIVSNLSNRDYLKYAEVCKLLKSLRF